MKRYIKPETTVVAVELEAVIAASTSTESMPSGEYSGGPIGKGASRKGSDWDDFENW